MRLKGAFCNDLPDCEYCLDRMKTEQGGECRETINPINETDRLEANLGLVGGDKCREILFPDPDSRISRRTWEEWKKLGLIPVVRIRRRCFYDVAEVRRALDKQFKIKARKS